MMHPGNRGSIAVSADGPGASAQPGSAEFIDVEIEVPTLAFRKREEDVQALAQTRDHVGRDRSEDIEAVFVDHRLDVGHIEPRRTRSR